MDAIGIYYTFENFDLISKFNDTNLQLHLFLFRLTPFGHSLTEPVPDEPLLLAAAKVGVDAIKDYNGLSFTYVSLRTNYNNDCFIIYF